MGSSCQRLVQRRFGGSRVAGGPLEVGQRQPRGDRFRIELHRLVERRGGRLHVAARLLHLPERRVGQAAVRIHADRVFHRSQCLGQIVEPCRDISFQQLRADVSPIEHQRAFDARAGILVLLRQQKDFGGRQLRVDVVRQKIGGPHLLAIDHGPVFERAISLGELQPGFPVRRIQLDHVAKFDDSFLVFLLSEINVGTLEVLSFRDLRRLRTADRDGRGEHARSTAGGNGLGRAPRKGGPGSGTLNRHSECSPSDRLVPASRTRISGLRGDLPGRECAASATPSTCRIIV